MNPPLRCCLPLLLAAVFLGSAWSAPGVPEPLPPAPTRPGADAGPTEVQIVAYFADILRIDSATQTFTVNLALLMEWRDPKFATAPGTPPRQFPLTEIWSPRWIVANPADSLPKALPDVATVAADGTAVYRQVILGSVAGPMNLRRFPFDRETFRVRLVIPGYRPDDLALVPSAAAIQSGMKEGIGRTPTPTMQDWTITAVSAKAEPFVLTPGNTIAAYSLEFEAVRNPSHYVLKVILPLLLIVLMSWSVFWIDPSMGASQISVAVTSILTLIAYRFAIGAEVPKLPYLTLLDAFILLATILVFLSLIEVVTTTALALKGDLTGARRLDRIARWGFPAVFFSTCTTLFFF